MRISENESQIKSILDKRIKAIHERELDTILALYTPDIITFDIKDPLQNSGVDSVKKRLEEWFASYKTPINQELQKLQIVCSEEVAFSYCLTRTYGTSIAGEKQDMWYRTTTGFKKVGSSWLITHEHVSDPIDMQTGKGMFDLKP